MATTTTTTVAVEDTEAAKATTDSMDNTESSRSIRIHFASPEATLVVPPETPLTSEEIRAAFYTYKELQSKHRYDIDNVTNYQEQNKINNNATKKPKRRHQLLLPPLHSYQQKQQQHQNSAPTSNSDNTISWRGLEYVVNNTTDNMVSRTGHVKETIQQIVALHKDCVAQGLPLMNDTLREASEERTQADRQRAADWGTQDAKDIGINDNRDSTHSSTPRRMVENLGKHMHVGEGHIRGQMRGQLRKFSHRLSRMNLTLPWNQ